MKMKCAFCKAICGNVTEIAAHLQKKHNIAPNPELEVTCTEPEGMEMPLFFLKVVGT